MAILPTGPIAHAAMRIVERPQPSVTESGAAILSRSKVDLIADWLARTKKA